MKYDFTRIEDKWQAKWEAEKPFAALNDSPKQKSIFLLNFLIRQV